MERAGYADSCDAGLEMDVGVNTPDKSSGMEADKARNWEVISSEYPNL